MMTAMTSRIWINPPMVVDVTTPTSHNTIKMITIVDNIFFVLSTLKCPFVYESKRLTQRLRFESILLVALCGSWIPNLDELELEIG